MYLRLIRASTDANRPALRTGQWFVATRLKKPALFTLVRYKSKSQYLINRVCGLPGDVVQLKAGILYINSQPSDKTLHLTHVYKMLRQDHADLQPTPVSPRKSKKLNADQAAYSVPPYNDILYLTFEDRFVDNNKIHCERYILPPGEREDAVYKTFKKNWNRDNFGPIRVPSGSFFVLGDNRPHATDSRHHGFIKQSQVLGSVLWK